MDVSTHADESVNERLLRDIALWQADGLISRGTAAALRERYGLARFGLGQVLRYLGIVGLIFLVCGILGLVAAFAGSPAVGAVLLLAVGTGFGAAGVVSSRDRLGRYRWSSKVALTLGAILVTVGVGLLLDSLGVTGSSQMFIGGWLVLPALVFLAYRFHIAFLLVIALIEFFHWIGSWTTMWGRSTYVFDVQDPRLMCVAALAVIGVGLWHEHELADETGRFYAAYESLGLVYLNMSLLILSIEDKAALFWVVVLTAAALGEVVLGARMKNRLMVGFGVTFLFIDGFTRFYETFWVAWEKAIFFLVIGLVTFAAGAGCELLLRAREGGSER